MARFVELHQPDNNGSTPVMVNADWIEYVSPVDDGVLLHLGTVNVDGQQNRLYSRPYILHVTEDYYTIKELLRCQ